MREAAVALAAEDADDLEIISARLQDAVTQVRDLVWLPKTRRFAGLFNRFKWETGENLRVRARLHFDHVLSVRSHNIRSDRRDAVVSLLAIRYQRHDAEDPAGTIELVLSGGGTIRLDVECIDAGLADLGSPWAARARPQHDES
jgi:hypothetical protein